MRFGVSAANIQPTGAGANACIARARHAEAIGFDSVWVHDHVAPTRSVRTAYPYGSGEQASERTPRDYLEVLTMLSALAVATRRVQIGTCVLAAPYRHPAVVAKMGATADRLSGGRCLIGIGDGWQREEFDVLNVPGDHFDHRFAVTTD
ncbi:MAG: LLM class flavin-dependent oxidoreductase, partial [Myxococcales bacterium]|nr:LLM class flavin-dependent oxidoreductase [Myxococcales bacterium]